MLNACCGFCSVVYNLYMQAAVLEKSIFFVNFVEL